MNLRELHREALTKFKEANLEKKNGNKGLYKQLIEEAFDLEKKAAELLIDEKQIEPTRSVLFRSAANLALLCNRFEEAKRLAELGLEGSPFIELKNELEEIIQKTLPVALIHKPAELLFDLSEKNIIQQVEENAYLASLRKNAIQIKVEEESPKFGGAIAVGSVVNFLQNLNESFKHFAQVNFIKALLDSKPDSVYQDSKQFSKNAKLLAVDLNFQSFGISVAADEGIMDSYKDHSQEYKTMRKQLFTEFKEDVLTADYNDYDFQQKIKKKYTEEERLKIYSPVVNSISNKSYRVAITNEDYSKKTNSFKPLNESAKKIFKPSLSNNEKKEENNIEYLNVIVAVETGKALTKKINLENSLFDSANTLKLNNEKFTELGFKYEFPIDINVSLSSVSGKSLLEAVYDGITFEIIGDANNLRDLYEKLIKKVAEYIANRDS
ncbi:hypothetical protein ACLI1A_07240 [Flavobacterium sp. RHBU_3]|uniref:hypothetical protein n=1 Tax=Flavobacterium sp. RHBU_3 TaxID=3391184 RepID=UPI003985669D